MEKHIKRFGAAAASYEKAGNLQDYVSARLTELMPTLPPKASIFEIGCGTGFLTRRLYQKYGDAARYVITDASPQMVETCKDAFGQAACGMQFMPMDGQAVSISDEKFDIIATSMTIQWFKKPAETLRELRQHLNPGGAIYYATIGRYNFPEWRRHLELMGLDCGMRSDLPKKPPGLCREEIITHTYNTGLGFLDMLKKTGAGTPKPGYIKPAPREFHNAVKSYDGKATWHIVYGCLPA